MFTDGRCLDGFGALWDVINQFSLVPDLSKGFKSDVLQFLQLKRRLEVISDVSPVGSSMTFTEVRCCVNSLLIKLHHCENDSLELVAKADMQFSCSASLKNGALLSLGLAFSSLELKSLPSTLILAQCTLTCPPSHVLEISLSKSIHEENELCVSLPSLDIWLHLSEWTKVLDLINSYARQLTKTTLLEPSSKNLINPLKNDPVDVSTSSHSASISTQSPTVNVNEDHVFLVVRSENVGITFNIPLWVSKEACRKLQLAYDYWNIPQNAPSDVLEEKDCKFIAVNLYSKNTILIINSQNIKIRSSFEKLSGMVLICNIKSVPSWPLFQIYQVDVEAKISYNHKELTHVDVEIVCDRSDVWLSHRIFYLLGGVCFNVPEAASSEFACVGIHVKAHLRKVSLLLSDGRVYHLLDYLSFKFCTCIY